ncbi:MAG TPA: NAD(P)/FAD-dependent oxidoreductase [Anaerolineales bacterium]|nr:NAD(P)/FAD-dependent oxidoreductase [Anaerolineales bacterium]
MSSPSIPSHWDVVIAGGGPAGFFAAIRCAEINPQLRVLVLERAGQTLGKVLISGGGRCNVTHACFDPDKLVTFYPRGANELRGAFSRFQAADTVEWFESRGVRLKTEADGRMFPVTDSSETIAECLRESAKKAGLDVRIGLSLMGVKQQPKNGFRLELRRGADVVSIQTKKLLIATGSDRRTLEIIQGLGHSIEEPVPSLFTFNIRDPRIEGLAGVSLEDVTLKMDTIVQRGPLLIMHWGLSGPVVLRVSAWGARPLHARKYQARLAVNWLGDYTFERALDVLQRNRDWKENARRKVNTQQAFSQVPSRLWRQIVQFIGEKNWADVSKPELRTLAGELTAGEFIIQGKGQFKEEFVTCGGVKLNEVDFKTMQSRAVEGLFFAGEVLNIDGLTGGFNFQSAWTTGWLAGTALAG